MTPPPLNGGKWLDMAHAAGILIAVLVLYVATGVAVVAEIEVPEFLKNLDFMAGGWLFGSALTRSLKGPG